MLQVTQKHWRQSKSRRPCNLCGQRFQASPAYRFFCEACRSTSDLYRYHDWLPEAPMDSDETMRDLTPRAA